ncbi:LPXTG-domain-containing protein cell wall anchor domain protein [Enterococcus casseliflavus]|uniref:MucBP domain-containing protein n=2 Tax=Enterococcus casseliflavus TaxID=37734 RepID=UPI000DF95EB3|nr:MucBP domain-containing protein [Enterococcus casseliflavus]STP33373.1 LPXTG-domain-containing protein cell wall anchor domain protein [Enterococcus casseliflavus]
MLKKLGIILVVGMMTLGHPLIAVAEGIEKPLQEKERLGEGDRESEDEERDESSPKNELNNENDPINSENSKDENASEGSSPVLSNSDEKKPEDSHEAINYEENDPDFLDSSDTIEQKNEENEEKLMEKTDSGTWGEVPWSWDEATKTITLEAGVAGRSVHAPWLTEYTQVEKIVVKGIVVLPSDSSGLFRNTNRLAQLDSASNFDVSNVTNMSSMFSNARELSSINVSSWDTSNVTNMSSMFNGTTALSSVDVSSWDTSNATNMSSMFSSARISSLNVSSWDTSNVTNMSYMFHNARELSSLDVSSWDTSKVTNMSNMFLRAENLSNVDVSSWDTSSVTNMASMFSNMGTGITALDVSSWDTSNVTDMRSMFANSSSLTTLDVSSWDTSSVTSMRSMFMGTRRLTALDVSSWNTSSVTDMGHLFSGTRSLTALDVSLWDTSNVTNMGWMFHDTENLRSLDVSLWDTSKVTDTHYMFNLTQRLTELDVSSWDVSNVTNMWSMFSSTSLSSLDLSSWDTSNVTNMRDMFRVTRNLSSITLGEKSVFSASANLFTVTSSSIYTGGWILDSEELTVRFASSEEFMDQYDGSKPGTYVWERRSPEPVTVHYLDFETEKPLAETVVLNGDIGAAFTTEPKEISGWYVRETPNNATGTFSGEAQEVIYLYERSDAVPVTVKYVNAEGNQLAEPTILSGKVGLPYASEAKEIPGWYVAETPNNASGTFTKEAQEVVYVYERSDAAPVTVKHKDSEGNQLAEPTILSGKVGLPYASEAKEIPGWYVAETPNNASGTFTKEAQEVVYVYERSDAAPVTVKHKDSEGNQLAEPTILSGKVGLPYASEAKEIPGWYVAETPNNASGTFTKEAQEVVYVYERSDAAPVTVKHKDSEGNQLSEPTILSGKVGLPYDSDPKEIPGWYVAETPNNASGTFTKEAQEVVYVYERSDAAPVTVKHKDSEGNQLAEPTILSGKVGLPYASEAKEIPGWYVAETPNNASGTFTKEAQEVVYVYERSDAAPVTVKHKDSEGNQLAEPTILSGKVGLPYASKAKEIPGWYVVEVPSNAYGTFTNKAQEVVYVYERSDSAPVIVKYTDNKGNQLAEPTILSGKVGLPYASEAKEISGWYVAETPNNAFGTFTKEAQEVVYVYERSDAAPVTVKHKDSEGNQLSEPTILSGKVGLPYASEAKEIPGWYVAEIPNNAFGTFTKEAQEVVYVYERSDAALVTVKYQDSKGNQLSEPTVLSGKLGLPYESDAKEILGWYVVEIPDNASGTFSDAAQEVVYVYSTKSHNSKNNDNSNNHLPKTGEQTYGQGIMTAAGALLVILSFVVGKKRKKGNH